MAGPNPDKIASNVEKLLRKELGSSTPLPYQIIPVAAESATAKSVLSDIGKALISTKQQANVLFYVHFALDLPRPFELQVTVTRYGLGAILGRFAYAVPLEKPVKGVIGLEVTKGWGYSYNGGFTGEPATIASLNSSRDLINQAAQLRVYTARTGNFTLTIPKYFQIAPHNAGSVLILHRLSQTKLFSANVGAKDLFTFVPQLEAAL